MRVVNQESLRWIACNPDNLVKTDKKTGINFNGHNYMPSKIKTYISKYSYNVYENRVILGFLKNVIDYLENQIIGFAKEIVEVENIPESIVAQLPNTHALTGKCVYVYYKGVVDRFSEKKDILEEIYYSLNYSWAYKNAQHYKSLNQFTWKQSIHPQKRVNYPSEIR